jgi:hypothetical protein
MNLTDAQQRAIYFYLRLGYFRAERYRGQWRYFSAETHRWRVCPPLDMNTWHDDVEPKLLATDVSGIELCSFNVAADFKGHVQPCKVGLMANGWAHFWQGHGATIEDACYAALLQYLGVSA